MRERENRNVLAWGTENQQKLNNSKILVVGSGLLSEFVLSGLYGLGTENIYLMNNARIKDNERSFLLNNEENQRTEKVKLLEDRLRDINHGINIKSIFSKFVEAFSFSYTPDIIINATNEPISKEATLRYALDYRIPLISVSSNLNSLSVANYVPEEVDFRKFLDKRLSLDSILMEEFSESRNGIISSMIAAGLACEELRKTKFSYNENDSLIPNHTELTYNLFEKFSNIENSSELAHKRVLLAGAGGIANPLAIILSLLGVGRIDIIDNDSVEESNLNRQLLFYDCLGENKAIALARKIIQINPLVKSYSFCKKIGEYSRLDEDWLKQTFEVDKERLGRNDANCNYFGSFELYLRNYLKSEENSSQTLNAAELARIRYDLIFGCLDNKYARLWLNSFAVNNNIPYIDGGSSYKSGQVSVYVPGKNKCIDCQSDLTNYPSRNISCAQAEPSVIMSNMIIAGIMAKRALEVFYDLNNEYSITRYDTLSDSRINLRRGINLTREHNC